MSSKLFKKLRKNKIALVIVCLIIIGVGYFGASALFRKKESAFLGLVQVEKGSLISSVSATGQIVSLSEVEIKPKVSGEIVYLGAKNGQMIGKGQLIAQIDFRDAQKSIRDAEINLENARISFEKFIQPADALAVLQAENSLLQTEETKKETEDNLKKSYEDGFNNLSNVFLDTPEIMAGLEDILFENTFNSSQSNINYLTDGLRPYDDKADIYGKNADDLYQKARQGYEPVLEEYKLLTRYSGEEDIEKVISGAYENLKDISDSLKSLDNLIRIYKDKVPSASNNSLLNAALSGLNSYAGDVNSHLVNLFSTINGFQNYRNQILDLERSILEKELSLADLKNGPDELDIKAQKLSLRQKENSLADAKEKLKDYFIYASLNGIIAGMEARVGDLVSSGTSLGSLITDQKMAEIVLNEIDVALVKLGQEVNLTLDAAEDLPIKGIVIDIDVLGEASQGVVSYNAKISFDADDERIKPGMSVSADIITENKPSTLLLPFNAVKEDKNGSYVEVLENGAYQIKRVETGSSNDLYIEILSGVSEGDEVKIGGSSGASGAPESSNSRNLSSQNDAGRMMMKIAR